MKKGTGLRILSWIAISLGLASLLAITLYASDLALRLWDRLLAAPLAFVIGYAVAIALLACLLAWWTWRIFKRLKDTSASPPAPLTESELKVQVLQSEGMGIDTAAAKAEIENLETRRASAKLFVALYGETSTGKSSLLRALAPNYSVNTDPRTGTTRELGHYAWTTPNGDEIILTDMPGLNAPNRALDDVSREEAERAHVVIYLVDGDITRAQYAELRQLLVTHKTLILALNKIDRYRDEELAQIRTRLRTRLGEDNPIEIVPVSAGGLRDVTKIHADGREETVVQPLPVRVDALVAALEKVLEQDRAALETRRDASVVALAQRKLDDSTAEYRRRRSGELISQYTHKAMLGALAAVSPGMDLLIQGYLGVAMVRAQCRLYQVPVRRLEIDKFLRLVTKDLGKSLPLVMAAAGNTLKAFPGIGTLAGGIVHAVGYGLLFESLGRALARTLEERGRLAAEPALQIMETELSEHLETRARRLARVVLASGGKSQRGG
jgi:ribosome biogenesis GTPase A